MRTSVLVIVLAVAVVAWLPTPASAQDGDLPGACVVIGGFFDTKGADIFSGCIDGVTEEFCLLDLCGFNPGSPDGVGGFEECFWDEIESCEDQNIAFDGGCDLKGLCGLISNDEGDPSDSAFLCEEILGGTWSPGDTTCGGAPVPALPKAAYAALALVLLGGTLTLLTLYSRS